MTTLPFPLTPAPTPEDLEAGRKLFAGPVDFVKGVVAMSGLPPADRIEVTPFFNLVHVWNYGVSFGMMQSGSNAATYTLIAVAIVITLLFAYFLIRAESWLVALGAGTVIGGAIGNIIDRFQYGAVYDFLDFHAFGSHWPAFNVADSCVLIGICLIILDNLRQSSKTTA